MRASVIVCLFVVALVGLGLRSRSESSRHAATRAHAQERAEVKGQKKPPKDQPAPAEPQPPKSPTPPEESQRQKQVEPEPLIHREPKAKSVEPPKVLWNRQVTGEARTTNTAAHQSALEAAALAYGDYLKERFPGFRWSTNAEFLNDMVVEEKEETVQLTEPDPAGNRLPVPDAPLLIRNTIKVEMRDSHLKAALQEDRKVRVE